MPITSCAPRLAEMNASPQTQAGIARPARKKSVLVVVYRFSAKPMPSTNAKYTNISTQSRKERVMGGEPRRGSDARMKPPAGRRAIVRRDAAAVAVFSTVTAAAIVQRVAHDQRIVAAAAEKSRIDS